MYPFFIDLFKDTKINCSEKHQNENRYIKKT